MPETVKAAAVQTGMSSLVSDTGSGIVKTSKDLRVEIMRGRDLRKAWVSQNKHFPSAQSVYANTVKLFNDSTSKRMNRLHDFYTSKQHGSF